MLGLKLPTDLRWVNIVEQNIEEILTDHAFCEQKATTNAINIIVRYPEYTEMVDELLAIAKEELQHFEMVDELLAIAKEELQHFEMVHEKIKQRGWVLGRQREDEYVNDLLKFVRRGFGRNISLVDKLLFSAIIEARSCERFKILSEKISDPDLKTFYHELMISEAGHYTTYLRFARKYAQGEDVDKRWQEFLQYEAEVISNYGKKETMHG